MSTHERFQQKIQTELRSVRKSINRCLENYGVSKDYEAQKRCYESFCRCYTNSIEFKEQMHLFFEKRLYQLPVVMAASKYDVYNHDRLIGCCLYQLLPKPNPLPTFEGFIKPILTTASSSKNLGEEIQLSFYSKLLEALNSDKHTAIKSEYNTLLQRLESIELRLQKLETTHNE